MLLRLSRRCAGEEIFRNKKSTGCYASVIHLKARVSSMFIHTTFHPMQRRIKHDL
jgi:hypothetical protein